MPLPTTTAREESPPELELRLLGPLEVRHRGRPQALPRSKKTRALLAYLAMSQQEHTRNRLCDLFWDVTDDRRGALRWSLSRLRKVLDHDRPHLHADRERVAFIAADASVDARELMGATKRGLSACDTEELERLATLARGEFLEGLELPDFFEFQAWCVASREEAREARCAVLTELVTRFREQPERALPHARARVQADSLSVQAHAEMLELLLRSGRTQEAQRQLELSRRTFREVDAPGLRELELRWRELASSTGTTAPATSVHGTPVLTASAPVGVPAPPASPSTRAECVGRDAELTQLEAVLEAVRSRGSQRIVLITGEPGAGKSHLADVLASRARRRGAAIYGGRAFEAESQRPYGPWVDALRTDLADLVTAATGPDSGGGAASRDALFARVADLLADAATQHPSAVVILDDLQWLDRDSAELLHYVARTSRLRPICLVLLARSGELADNEHALRTLRGLRRETQIEEITLAPLTRAEVADLVAHHAGVDVVRIHEASAGNPLYALELARAAAAGVGDTPPSLAQLVKERIEHLPGPAAEVLRWGAVLGHVLDVSRLQALSTLGVQELVDVLERLEQHELLRASTTATRGQYTFAHDVVRQTVYGELSHPRRQLMHQRVARLLDAEADQPGVATELAHHASLAGDALLAVRACTVAGQRSLRLFANGDAEALAKRGLRLVDGLAEDTRITATLELLHILYSAHTPQREIAAARIRELIDQALDAGQTTAARLGFQMLSYLRWEGGSMAQAHENILRAERISRSAAPEERAMALSQAAKCLVLLERNLSLAEAFLLEADALTTRGAASPSAMQFATGLMCVHRGEHDAAADAFREARQLGREQGDRLAEFGAVEHLMMLEIDRERYTDALELGLDLSRLGERVREGAETACSRALQALAARGAGAPKSVDSLDASIAALRAADSKYRLAYVLTRLAGIDLHQGACSSATEHATDALQVATEIGRASEMALAHVLLARCAQRLGDVSAQRQHLSALQELRSRDLSAHARDQLEATTRELG